MKPLSVHWIILLSFFAVASVPGLSAAEQHRATRLGNPATRFAPPLSTPEDLRARFRDPKLKPDFAEVLRQWGWKGNVEDMHRAAATAPIQDIRIPVGSTMPFMSSRENGKPICLRDVLWAGQEPAPAYAFNFSSRGQRYRCVTPKACSNFFLEDLGPEPAPALAIECVAPRQSFPGRPAEVCLIVRNPGTGTVTNGVVRLMIPESAKLISASDAGVHHPQSVAWAFATLKPREELRFCAKLDTPVPGDLKFESTVIGGNVTGRQTSCSTKIIGIPAILIDAVDLEDPIQVGSEVTYDIKVTNQGSTPATNVKLVFVLPPNEEYVSGGGPTPVRKEADIFTEPLPVLAPKDAVTWRVVVKAVQAGDVRFKIQLSSDQFTKPIHEEESTLLY